MCESRGARRRKQIPPSARFGRNDKLWIPGGGLYGANYCMAPVTARISCSTASVTPVTLVVPNFGL
jgi:hypothetical protein